MSVYGTGEQIRCFTYVTDVVEANLLLLKEAHTTTGEIYNVASKTRISVKELTHKLIEKYATTKIEVIHEKPRRGENLRPIPDTSKIEALGFKSRMPFDEGLDRTKDWILDDMREEMS